MFSSMFVGLSVLGLAVLTFAQSEPPSPIGRVVLTSSWMAFWMIGTVARSARALLERQADQIAALEQRAREGRPAA